MRSFISLLIKIALKKLINPKLSYKLGTFLLKFPPFSSKFNKIIHNEAIKMIDNNKKLYSKYKCYYTIPEIGLDYETCRSMILEYSNSVISNVKNIHFSGTLYQNALTEQFDDIPLPNNLESLYIEIYRRSHMWNGMHHHHFGIANLINLQLVSCVADLFGGSIDNVCGVCTNGGSQSIMVSARAYMNYFMANKYQNRSYCIILAPDTIHASLIKASEAYGFRLILMPTIQGKINYQTLQKYVNKYIRGLAAIYCSLPSFPYGTNDDVELFATIANKYNVGLHVDCCLGGFIVNFIDEKYSKLLQMEGITSLSVDTHKNGLGPKGSSVLITKNIGWQNLLYYSAYAFSTWKGGLYGSIKDEGSTSCVENFNSLITLLYYGKVAYRKTACEIYSTCQKIVQHIEQKEFIEIINDDVVNVVAFRVTIKFGSSYRLNDLMCERGYIFNVLDNNEIHFCVTKRFVCDANVVDNFLLCFDECMKLIENEIDVDPQLEYDGGARLYCSLDSMKYPSDDQTIWSYAENFFLGIIGIESMIKCHVMTINNPYYCAC